MPTSPGALGRRLVVVGQGYVGLPLAMRAAEVGYQVVGYDINERRTKRLAAGESYVEDVPDAVVASAIDSGRYLPTSDASRCAGFDVAVMTVPTPLRDGVPDLSSIEAAARTLALHLRAGTCVVLESTTWPGTTEEFVAPLLEDGSGLFAGEEFHLGYSPERIDPGNPTWTLVNTPKVVSGIDQASLEAVDAFYRSLVERTFAVSTPKVAELTKLLENTFRHVNVALVNELTMFASELGIDVWEAIDAATTKPFGYMRFTPGPGVGGHCLPIDPSYLSWRVQRTLGHRFRFVELANDVNDHMPEFVVRRIAAILNRSSKALKGSRILLIGLAYKPNTGDARESPALAVAGRLLASGATVTASDPYVSENGIDPRIVRVEPTPAELAAADVVVVLTDHDAFDYDSIVEHSACLFDTRRRTAGGGVELL